MADKKKPGRPTVFNDLVREKILDLVSEGKTDEEIADIIGISRKTLLMWKRHKQEFGIAMREAKLDADKLVEAALFQKAIGWNGLPPDTQAAQFWLKNRQPDKWREKSEVDQNIKGSLNVNAIIVDAVEKAETGKKPKKAD